MEPCLVLLDSLNLSCRPKGKTNSDFSALLTSRTCVSPLILHLLDHQHFDRFTARHKLESSPVLRAAMETGNWHVVLWPHLRAWLEREPPDLVALEPYLGLDPAIERRAEQLGLFELPKALP